MKYPKLALAIAAALTACAGPIEDAPTGSSEAPLVIRILCPTWSKPYGLIGQFYAGHSQELGCALEAEHDAENPGRAQRFEHGAIAWSPGTGPNSVQGAWVSDNGGSITVAWGDTSPFNYDFFLVRWDLNGQNVGQAEVRGARTSGTFTFPIEGDGQYSIVIEGCDDGGFLSGATCRQGWSNRLLVWTERARFCADYAASAVAAYNSEVKLACQYSGLRWSGDELAHKNWCMTASYADARSESQGRAGDLKSCACTDQRVCYYVPVTGSNGFVGAVELRCIDNWVCRPY